jgi:hypothetical protein
MDELLTTRSLEPSCGCHVGQKIFDQNAPKEEKVSANMILATIKLHCGAGFTGSEELLSNLPIIRARLYTIHK